jgi:hypothetical protein
MVVIILVLVQRQVIQLIRETAHLSNSGYCLLISFRPILLHLFLLHSVPSFKLIDYEGENFVGMVTFCVSVFFTIILAWLLKSIFMVEIDDQRSEQSSSRISQSSSNMKTQTDGFIYDNDDEYTNEISPLIKQSDLYHSIESPLGDDSSKQKQSYDKIIYKSGRLSVYTQGVIVALTFLGLFPILIIACTLLPTWWSGFTWYSINLRCPSIVFIRSVISHHSLNPSIHSF